MDSEEAAEEIIDKVDNETIDYKAMESIADWSVSATPVFDAQKDFAFL